jgi:hypothetical protein
LFLDSLLDAAAAAAAASGSSSVKKEEGAASAMDVDEGGKEDYSEAMNDPSFLQVS